MPIGRRPHSSIAIPIAIALLLCACGREAASPPRPNIVLITIDTLRADHLSCYGYHRQTSPFIDSLAQASVVFTNAYATSSWTAPSMASIFTGHYPRGHGVLHGVARGPQTAIVGQEMLVEDFVTLAEVLQAAGYTTFGVSSNGHMSRSTGFSQGFDYFATHWFMKSPAPHASIREWQEQIDAAAPYFLWIHYFDPHNPYAPRMPWVKEYTDESNSYSQWTRKPLLNPKDHIAEIREDPRALDTLKDRYDSEINYCDRHIAHLFELLPAATNTLVVLTADHGEAFLDHGQLLHGNTLFEEEARVPLIIRLPGDARAARTIPQPVSNRNLFATILEITGLDAGPDVPGVSLMPLISGAAGEAQEDVFLELDWVGWGRAVRSGSWKLIVSGREEQEAQLFDLKADPAERRDLIAERPQRAGELRSRLQRWIAEHPEFAAPLIETEIDPQREERLRSLGYL